MIEWVKVSDRLPNEGQRIFIFTEYDEIIRVYFKDCYFGKYNVDEVIYWAEEQKILPPEEKDPFLINCPFCKGENNKYYRSTLDMDNKKHVIGCADCNFYKHHKTKEQAVEWWNRGFKRD